MHHHLINIYFSFYSIIKAISAVSITKNWDHLKSKYWKTEFWFPKVLINPRLDSVCLICFAVYRGCKYWIQLFFTLTDEKASYSILLLMVLATLLFVWIHFIAWYSFLHFWLQLPLGIWIRTSFKYLKRVKGILFSVFFPEECIPTCKILLKLTLGEPDEYTLNLKTIMDHDQFRPTCHLRRWLR